MNERLLRFSGWLFLVLVMGTAAVMVLGGRLPVEHTASVTATLAIAPERVWGLLTNVAEQPRWRSSVRAVEMLPEQDGHMCWREQRGMTWVALCEESRQEARRWVVRIVDTRLPFGGSWEYGLAPEGAGGTRLTITERGTTGPEMWRFWGHYVTGEDGAVKAYVKDLEAAADGGSGSGGRPVGGQGTGVR